MARESHVFPRELKGKQLSLARQPPTVIPKWLTSLPKSLHPSTCCVSCSSFYSQASVFEMKRIALLLYKDKPRPWDHLR